MLILSVITFIKNYGKFIFIPLVIIMLLLGIYFYGNASGKHEYKEKCTGRIAALHLAAQQERDELQSKVDAASEDFELWKTEQQKANDDVIKKYDDGRKNNSISACPASADFLQLYRQAAGYSAGAESETSR